MPNAPENGGRDEFPRPSPLIQAKGMRSECVEVGEFIRRVVRPPIEGVPGSDRKSVLLGQLLRVQGWLSTLQKLDSPSDFQAVVSAERALFEIAIDIVLVGHNAFPPEQMIDWEDSAKLKQVEAGTLFYGKRKEAVPSHYATGYAARLRVRETIEERRRALGWETHPNRWTGSGRSLLVDSQLADRQVVRFGFEEWYETRYRELCWSVHGSALALRQLPMDSYPELVAISFRASADLAEQAAASVLKGLDAWSDLIEGKFEVLKQRRAFAFAVAAGWVQAVPPSLRSRVIRAGASLFRWLDRRTPTAYVMAPGVGVPTDPPSAQVAPPTY